MKNLLFTVFCLTFVQFTFGQNYYPVNRKDIHYYSDSSKSVAFALKIDSVKKIGQDSVYYMYKQIRNRTNTGTNFRCEFTSLGDSWFGNTIKISPEGSCVILNKNKSEFLIKTKAALNEKWVAYQNNIWKAEITFTNKERETFLGITDSVKIFTVNILKINNSDTTHSYDGVKFKLSKNYGFIELVNIFTWDNSGDYNENQLYRLKIEGMENAKLGLYNYSVRDIYNYSIGDIFQYEESYNCTCPNGYFKQTIDSIISKTETDTSLVYNVTRKSKNTPYNPNNTTFSNNNFNLIYEFKNLGFLDDFNRIQFKYDTTFNGWKKRDSPNLLNYQGKIDTCLNYIIDGGGCYSDYYLGFGNFHNECDYYFYNGSSSEKLVYYKKGSNTWGQRIVLGIDESEFNIISSFKLSPNPASTYIQYSLANQIKDGELRLLDVLGNVAYSTPLNQAEGNIDVSKLGRGIYFYQISSSSKPVLSGKIVIE
ncbi:MAG: T9SS type A sorting domain-containing protein [Cytophagales bacterium]|nr:T9SS type A sorting domain-containing protein [Cytophagales bacterium]